MRAVQLEYIV